RPARHGGIRRAGSPTSVGAGIPCRRRGPVGRHLPRSRGDEVPGGGRATGGAGLGTGAHHDRRRPPVPPAVTGAGRGRLAARPSITYALLASDGRTGGGGRDHALCDDGSLPPSSSGLG